MVIPFWTSHTNGPLGLYTGLLSFGGKKKNHDKKWLLLLVLGLLLAPMALISLPIPVWSEKVPPPTPAANLSPFIAHVLVIRIKISQFSLI